MCGKKHNIAKVILALILIWILMGCAYQQPPLQPAPEEPPSPVELKPETPVTESDMPAEPTPITAVVTTHPPVIEIPTPVRAEPRVYLHKVRWAEETLSHIAKWYTGTVKNWKAIAKANLELDPKKIDVGNTIFIPEDLLTSRKPMPHSFVRASAQTKGAPLSTSKKTSTTPRSPKMFGPIESEPLTIEADSTKLYGPVETLQPPIESDAAKLFGPIE